MKRQFLQMTPTRFFAGLSACTSAERQEELVDLLRSRYLSMFPPSRAYTRAFLKTYLALCERASGNTAECMYEAVAEAVGEADVGEERVCYKTYLFSSSADHLLLAESSPLPPPFWHDAAPFPLPRGCVPVVLQETPQMISQGTTGLCTWPAAMYLAEWIGEHASLFSGRRVLELGAGVGLAGLALARITAAKSLVLSDCSGQVLSALEKNLVLNGLCATWLETRGGATDRSGRVQPDVPLVSATASPATTAAPAAPATEEAVSQPTSSTSSVELMQLDWRDAVSEEVEAIGADLVIAADVVYDGDIIPHLVKVIDFFLRAPSHCGRHARECIIASTQRNEDTMRSFVSAWDSSRYRLETEMFQQRPGTLVYDATCPIFLHRIRLL